jgi:hypothetical protein
MIPDTFKSTAGMILKNILFPMIVGYGILTIICVTTNAVHLLPLVPIAMVGLTSYVLGIVTVGFILSMDIKNIFK